MKNIYKILVFISLFLINSNLFSQTYVNKEWESITGTLGTIDRTASVLDNNEDLIVVSNTLSTLNNTDVLITKYDPEGIIIWQTTFDGATNGDDYAVQVKVNSSNDIFVASTIYGTSSNDFGILKYSENGTLQWSNTWNGSANGIDVPADLDIDNLGNIYLVGGTEATNNMSDYAIVKFNSAGVYQWNTTYDYNNLHDGASSLKFDNNSIIVTGASASTTSEWDFATLQINATNGTIQNTERTVVAGVGLDNALAVTTDQNNNIYITGYVDINGNTNIQTVKLNSSFGFEWVRNFDGGLEDIARAIGVDNFGNVYITGSTENSYGGKDCITIKYNSLGIKQWSKKYGSLNSSKEAVAKKLIVTNTGDIVIAGTIEKNGNKDFTLIKYSEDGDVKLVKEFDSGNQDEAKTITVKDNNFYISGTSIIDGIKKNATVKYSIKEKIAPIEYAPNGKPLYIQDELIVKFNISAINTATIDLEEYEFGKLSEFLTPTALSEINSALSNLCNTSNLKSSNNCNINVHKVFQWSKSTDSTTINRLGETIKLPPVWATLVLEFPTGIDVEQVSTIFDTIRPTIIYSHPNMVGSELTSANDPLYQQQSSLDSTAFYPSANINVNNAWLYEKGKSFIKVGVFDSGVDWAHEDFGDGSSTNSKIIDGWDYFLNHTMADSLGDYKGHGTSVAGIIGAIRNNNKGIAGIAGGSNSGNLDFDSTGVSIISLKIFHEDSVTNYTMSQSRIANAIHYASLENLSGSEGGYNFPAYALNIMNNSWSYNSEQPYVSDVNFKLLKEAVHFANRQNVTFIASRGNEGVSNPAYPAVIDEDWVLCVGATDVDGQYLNELSSSYYSASTGWEIDVAAPGHKDNITTTLNNGGMLGNYVTFDGSSASAPHVSGLAALLMSYLNDENPHPKNLAPEDIENIIEMTATDCDTFLYQGIDSLTGYGRINAGKALAQVDKAKYHLSHFTNDNDSLTGGIGPAHFIGRDTIQFHEEYVNNNNIVFYPNTDYIVSIYKHNFTVNHNIQSSDSIVKYWGRASSSNLFPPINSDGILVPRERSIITSLNNQTCNGTGYVYIVDDIFENELGWVPFDSVQQNYKFAYTVLHYDSTIILGINENELFLNDFISVYPNPSNNNQTLKFNFPTKSNLKVKLYDITGKLIYDIYNSKIKAGKNIIKVNIEKLDKGIYFYKIKVDNNDYSLRMIKK